MHTRTGERGEAAEAPENGPTHLATPREGTPKGELLLGVGKRASIGAYLGCASRWHFG